MNDIRQERALMLADCKNKNLKLAKKLAWSYVPYIVFSTYIWMELTMPSPYLSLFLTLFSHFISQHEVTSWSWAHPSIEHPLKAHKPPRTSGWTFVASRKKEKEKQRNKHRTEALSVAFTNIRELVCDVFSVADAVKPRACVRPGRRGGCFCWILWTLYRKKTRVLLPAILAVFLFDTLPYYTV